MAHGRTSMFAAMERVAEPMNSSSNNSNTAPTGKDLLARRVSARPSATNGMDERRQSMKLQTKQIIASKSHDDASLATTIATRANVESSKEAGMKKASAPGLVRQNSNNIDPITGTRMVTTDYTDKDDEVSSATAKKSAIEMGVFMMDFDERTHPATKAVAQELEAESNTSVTRRMSRRISILAGGGIASASASPESIGSSSSASRRQSVSVLSAIDIDARTRRQSVTSVDAVYGRSHAHDSDAFEMMNPAAVQRDEHGNVIPGVARLPMYQPGVTIPDHHQPMYRPGHDHVHHHPPSIPETGGASPASSASSEIDKQLQAFMGQLDPNFFKERRNTRTRRTSMQSTSRRQSLRATQSAYESSSGTHLTSGGGAENSSSSPTQSGNNPAPHRTQSENDVAHHQHSMSEVSITSSASESTSGGSRNNSATETQRKVSAPGNKKESATTGRPGFFTRMLSGGLRRASLTGGDRGSSVQQPHAEMPQKSVSPELRRRIEELVQWINVKDPGRFPNLEDHSTRLLAKYEMNHLCVALLKCYNSLPDGWNVYLPPEQRAEYEARLEAARIANEQLLNPNGNLSAEAQLARFRVAQAKQEQRRASMQQGNNPLPPPSQGRGRKSVAT